MAYEVKKYLQDIFGMVQLGLIIPYAKFTVASTVYLAYGVT